jgi:argonaute-like protein implicated in RNA metabolism and viral defense
MHTRWLRRHDAHVIQQLKQNFDIVSSVIHTTVGSLSYEYKRDAAGKTHYVVKPSADRRLNGYLRNVSINKILLLNQKWPFVLATPLHADLVIGIDVKGNMAGFIATNKKGNLIVPFHKKSRQKERLLASQCRDYFYQIVEKMRAQSIEPVKHIVIHRDGRIFETEIEGLKLGLEKLKESGYVDPDAALTFVEIPQTSPAALRLFDISHTDSQHPDIQNAQFGNYYVLNTKEGFVCTTGRAFRHKGTAKPLHVIKREGPLPIEKCLEDVFFLCCLAWTRPEDCSRDPITTKLNDRWLGEEGADHKEESETDSDALEATV